MKKRHDEIAALVASQVQYSCIIFLKMRNSRIRLFGTTSSGALICPFNLIEL